MKTKDRQKELERDAYAKELAERAERNERFARSMGWL